MKTVGTEHVAGSEAIRIPIVDYLVLDPEPHLVAISCDWCAARFFDRRNACASCGGIGFNRVPVRTSGHVRTFTIVHLAAPGVTVPFVAAVIDCDGTSVRANLINTPPDDEHVAVGMAVNLAVYPLCIDASGREAVGFGFEPAGFEPTNGKV